MGVQFEQFSVNTWKINNVYDFMNGETFHPFGGEVTPTGD